MKYQLKCDTHTHTLFSRHAYSTIEENIRAAAEQGMELLASTDHYSAMLFPEAGPCTFASSGLAQYFEPNPGLLGLDHRNYQYLSTMHSMWPREWHGVTLLRGCEADIIDLDGTLFSEGVPCPVSVVGDPFRKEQDLFENVTRKMDYVIASIHGKRFTEGATRTQMTEMYIRTMEKHANVLILAHIGRSGLDIDVDEVLKAAKAMHRLIELNEHSFDSGDAVIRRCYHVAERCAELGVPVSTATDAHISFQIGKMQNVEKMLADIDFPEELVASRDRKHFLAAMQAGVGTVIGTDAGTE